MNKLIQPALLLATLAFVAAPALTPPFTGYDPGIFPVRINRPFVQPAGYAFAIWGPIYLWLTLHAMFGLTARRGQATFTYPAWPLFGAILLGIGWLAIAGQFPRLATAMIVIMAALALTAYLRADQTTDRGWLAAPLSIFAGWLTAAAGVSTGVIVAGYGLLSNATAALSLLAIVLALALWVQRQRPRMPLYGLTVAWACIGIAVANGSDARGVALTALGGAALMTVTSLWPLQRRI